MFDFIKNRKIFFTISIAIFAVTILSVIFFGINLDIQFKGGSIVSYSFDGSLDQDAFQSVIEDELNAEASIQVQTDIVTQKTNYVVSLSAEQGIDSEKQLTLSNKLKETFPDNNIETTSINNVDPIIGKEFFAKSMVAVACASLLILLYVAFRFKKIGGWSAGSVAILALVHDVLVVFATFIIFRIPINDNFIAVVLTILGYSMNDTIVVYDRIRENERLMSAKTGLGVLVNTSINQSLTRSINTTVATLLAIGTVTVVALIYNVNSILTFTFPMVVGMISGLYSSVCITGPLWVLWQERKSAKHHS